MASADDVPLDDPVEEVEPAPGVPRDIVFVGDHQDGLSPAVQPDEHIHDLGRRTRVQVPGRLVREEDGGLVDERPGHGHALSLPPGELRRLV